MQVCKWNFMIINEHILQKLFAIIPRYIQVLQKTLSVHPMIHIYCPTDTICKFAKCVQSLIPLTRTSAFQIGKRAHFAEDICSHAHHMQVFFTQGK